MTSGSKLPLCLHSQVAIFLQNAQCLYRFCQVPPAGCSLMIPSYLYKLYRGCFITCHRNPIATVYLSQVLLVMSSLSSDKQTLQCHIGIVRFACLGVPPPYPCFHILQTMLCRFALGLILTQSGIVKI